MLSVGYHIPEKTVLLSSGDAKQKAALLPAAQLLDKKGFSIFATTGTYHYLTANGVNAQLAHWPGEEGTPQALDLLHEKKIDFVVNIPKNLSTRELSKGYMVRRAAIDYNIPLITNGRLATAFIHAFCTLSVDDIQIKSWDEYK
jgi:carbamoyl-phosphate synthase large subunit